MEVLYSFAEDRRYLTKDKRNYITESQQAVIIWRKVQLNITQKYVWIIRVSINVPTST